MLTITGEVRKVLPSSYTNRKTGEEVSQAVLVLEPSNQRQNYEITFNSKQLQSGVVAEWECLKGKIASIEVMLYVNHQHGFHKFSAAGNGKPMEGKS